MNILGAKLSDVMGRLSEFLGFLLPFGAESRLHWTGLGALLCIGTVIYLIKRKAIRQEGYTGLVDFLIPLKLYRTTSSAVDMKIYLANKMFVPLKSLVFLGVFSGMTLAIMKMTGATGKLGDESNNIWLLGLATVLSALATDLAYYITHRASHEIDWLWPFHKVHHSAEVLTPITAKRNHPVFDILLKAMTAALSGSMAGLIFSITGTYAPQTIVGVGAFIVLFNLTGGALRHSHIWLDYGPILDRILISPAQHQIHHSCAPHHHDRNYGLIFAIWDWMFGSLYVPQGHERLEYGISDRTGRKEPQSYNSLVEAYTLPFREASAVLSGKCKQPDTQL